MLLLGLTGAALVGVMTACSSSSGSKPAPGTTASNSGTSTGSGAPSPHATESNVAGDIPDTQAFVPYPAANNTFTVQVPEGWARTTSGAAVVFTDKYNSIRIETVARPSAPTVAFAQSTELPGISAGATGFSAGQVKSVQRNAGPAILITYRADSAPNAVTGKVAVEAVERYEFWKNGTEVTLTLAAPVGSDNVDPWRKVTDSFSWHA
ncbi:MAG: hypothetical protein JWO57_1716 [Pseudonocardiales bacterium]|nr:hypothetical protein [Pseudonocardiales bacterium]